MKLQTAMFSWFTGTFFLFMIILYFIIAFIISEDLTDEIEPMLKNELNVINNNQLNLIKELASDSSELALLVKKFKNTPHGDFSYNNQLFSYSSTRLPSPEEVYLSLVVADQLPKDYIQHSTRHLNEIRQAINTSIILVHVILLMFIVWVVRSISKSISYPVTAITHSLKQVAQGNFNEPLEISSKHSIEEIVSLRDSFYSMISSLKEKERVRSILDKVVSPKIAEEITKGNIQLGGEVRNISLLFADVRGFTKMTEFMPPEETIAMLNRVMTRTSQVIQKHDGVIDKYIGDMVMALFGAPLADADSVIKSVTCAWEMILELDIANRERAAKGKPPIHIGIGIHYGPMLVGNMGAENRLNYTVVGANVNLASRLCSIAKEREIVISGEIANDSSVKQRYSLQQQDPIHLKGFSEPITYFTVSGPLGNSIPE